MLSREVHVRGGKYNKFLINLQQFYIEQDIACSSVRHEACGMRRAACGTWHVDLR